MRIAQVAPIWYPIPPALYGGTERIVYHLTEGLVKNGHHVTLFGTGDSQTSAKLVPTVPQGLYQMGIPWDNVSYPLYHMTEVYDRAGEFDLIHVHLYFASDFTAFPLSILKPTPSVFTLHFRLKKAQEAVGADKVLMKYRQLNFVSISHSQQALPLNYVATVYNGVPTKDFVFQDKPHGQYLLWMGRVAPIKGAKEAIEVAQAAGVPLVIAGKVDQQDPRLKNYYEQEIVPLVDGTKVRFVGELGLAEKVKVYQQAKALIFPLKWDEPFGLIMTEAMACGTPVVAYNRGSVPEIVRDGLTGFIVEPDQAASYPSTPPNPLLKRGGEGELLSGGHWIIKQRGIAGLVEAVRRIGEIDRIACRKHVEENFTVEKMVEGYERVYEKVLSVKR